MKSNPHPHGSRGVRNRPVNSQVWVIVESSFNYANCFGGPIKSNSKIVVSVKLTANGAGVGGERVAGWTSTGTRVQGGASDSGGTALAGFAGDPGAIPIVAQGDTEADGEFAGVAG